MRLAEAGEEDPPVVVDLGHGADGRPRALARRLLLDADGRRQAGDLLDLRLLQRGQELAGVAGEALDVASLPFRIERVDRQRALARSATARCTRSSCAAECRGRPPSSYAAAPLGRRSPPGPTRTTTLSLSSLRAFLCLSLFRSPGRAPASRRAPSGSPESPRSPPASPPRSPARPPRPPRDRARSPSRPSSRRPDCARSRRPCCPGSRSRGARRAACGRRRNGGRSSARRGCRASGPSRASPARGPA